MQSREMQLRLTRERRRIRSFSWLELERGRVGAAQVQMRQCLPTVERGGPFEQRQRGVDVTVAQRRQRHDIERLEIVRVGLEHTAKSDLGLFGLALLEE